MAAPETDWVQIVNSNFATSAVSLASVCVGALLGTRLSERSKSREELTKEFRATQIAISLAHVVANAALNLKKQHLRDMIRRYDESREAARQHSERLRAGEQVEVLNVQFDLLTLPPLGAPAEDLRALCHDRTGIVGRPLAMTLALADSVAQAERLIVARNRLVEGYKGRPMNVAAIASYFGFPLESKHGRVVNEEMRDVTRGLGEQIDNILFFSRELGDDLAEHGDKLKEDWRKNGMKRPPPTGRIDWSNAEPGLFPNREDYPDWLGWSSLEVARTTRWVRLFAQKRKENR